MRGVYQHCSEKHLHRYLAEFDFRYNHREALGWNDEARAIAAVRSGEGSASPISNLVKSKSLKAKAAHFSKWRDRY